MNKQYKNISLRWLSLSLFLISGFFAHAQETSENSREKWAVQFNVQHRDLAFQLDFGQLGTVHNVWMRPYYSLEAQRFFLNNRLINLFVSTRLGYYHNLYHDRWFTYQFGLGLELHLTPKLYLSGRMEGGVGSVKNADIVYALENGQWVETEHFSERNGSGLITARGDLGYRISEKWMPLDLVLTSQLSLHHNVTFNGLVPYYSVGLGLRAGF